MTSKATFLYMANRPLETKVAFDTESAMNAADHVLPVYIGALALDLLIE